MVPLLPQEKAYLRLYLRFLARVILSGVAKRRESVRKQHGALFSLERDRTAVDRRPLPSDIHNFAFCILHFAFIILSGRPRAELYCPKL